MMICDRHNTCGNKVCRHNKPHAEMDNCGIAGCGPNGDKVVCIVSTDDELGFTRLPDKYFLPKDAEYVMLEWYDGIILDKSIKLLGDDK